MDKFPSQTQDKFTVRFPEGLRDRIAEIARINGRSMNSEIVYALSEYAFPKNLKEIAGKVTLPSEQMQGKDGSSEKELMDYISISVAAYKAGLIAGLTDLANGKRLEPDNND